jgi:RHS repeat-associated protein
VYVRQCAPPHFEYTPYGELFVEDKALTDSTPYRFTGKELDEETGLIYFGARYLNPQTSMWLSADPAMGEYIPVAPINDDAKKHNQNLPGMGGVYNYVNLHVYHYAGNNPVKLTDPDGRIDVRLGAGVGGAAFRLKVQIKDGRLTLGVLAGVGAGAEVKVSFTDKAPEIGTKIGVEGNVSARIGNVKAGIAAEVSTDSSGGTVNKATVTLGMDGLPEGVPSKIQTGVDNGTPIAPNAKNPDIEIGVGVMAYAGVSYETTIDISSFLKGDGTVSRQLGPGEVLTGQPKQTQLPQRAPAYSGLGSSNLMNY